MAKVTKASDAKKFTDIPNVGKAVAQKLIMLNLKSPSDLKTKDAYALYTKLNKLTGMRNNPCLLDTFIAAIDFMNGAPSRYWFYYTKDRKKQYPKL
ncbi:helix-hairpin-helix domain-containing protein [Patescibacteria group bacterium]|nr:helix-hairpin-helix domain-containing protein [Patescibacteria group bacterium]